MFTRLRSQFAVSVSGLCSPVFVVLVTFRLESVDVLVVVAVLVVWLLVGWLLRGGQFNCFLSDCILKLVTYSYIAFSVSSWLSVSLWR